MSLFPSSKALVAAAAVAAFLGSAVIAKDEDSASSEHQERVETIVKDGVIKIRINDGKEITIPLPDAGEATSSDDKKVVEKEVRVITLNSAGEQDQDAHSAHDGQKKMRVRLKGKAIMIGDDGQTAVLELDPKNLSDLEHLHKHLSSGSHSFSWVSAGDDHAMELASAGKYMIGVHPEEISDVLRAHLPVQEGVGLIVAEVVEGSPAEDAGIEKQDILLKVNDVDLKGISTLIEQVQKAGESKEAATVVVLRRGKQVTVHVTPKEREMGEGMKLHMKALESHGDAANLAKKLAILAEEKGAAAVAAVHDAAGQAQIEALKAEIEGLKAEIKALRKEIED
jgi:PDZ domain